MKYLLLLLCTGCATAEGHRLVSDWQDARADGVIDEADIRVIDRDVEDLDAAMRAPPIPHTGIPWLDVAMGAAGLLVTAAGTHKYTMRARDKTRAQIVSRSPSRKDEPSNP